MTRENTQTLLKREDIQITETTQIGRFKVITCEYKMDEIQREVSNARIRLQFNKSITNRVTD